MPHQNSGPDRLPPQQYEELGMQAIFFQLHPSPGCDLGNSPKPGRDGAANRVHGDRRAPAVGQIVIELHMINDAR
jgi:hypothetical protein